MDALLAKITGLLGKSIENQVFFPSMIGVSCNFSLEPIFINERIQGVKNVFSGNL